MSLTPRQERFVDEYLVDLCGKDAAIRAGYARRHANDYASQLLALPDVAKAITEAKVARSKRTGVDADWVLSRLTDEAEADLADIHDDNGAIMPIEEWPLIWRQGLVTGMDVEQLFEGKGNDRKQVGIVRKLRLSDRVRRLEMIGKHIAVNAFQDVVEVKGLSGLAERLERAQAREKDRDGIGE